MSLTPKTCGVLFLLGAAVAGVSQLFTPTRWWLNSSDGVKIEVIVLFLLAASVFFSMSSRSGDGRRRAETLTALWLGAMAGFTGALAAIGPGSIFPIVLAVAAGLSAAALTGGAVVGFALRTLLTRRLVK